jgi:hypothetical protein
MAFPLIPIVTALATGGTLVPHAAGRIIVTSAAGYVAGTYLSTSAIVGLLTATTATVGTGIAAAVVAFKGIVGGAGAGLSVGAATTKATGARVLSRTPVWIPVAIAAAAVSAVGGSGYIVYRIYKLKRKVLNTPNGAEAQFSEAEAKMVEQLIRLWPKKRIRRNGVAF